MRTQFAGEPKSTRFAILLAAVTTSWSRGWAQAPAAVLVGSYEPLWSIQSAPGGSLVVHSGSDLDLDGCDDLLVGEPVFGLQAGRVRAVSGAGGAILWETEGSQVLQAVPNGVIPGELLGTAIASLDWDGDGALDVAIGAPKYCNGPCPALQQGRVLVVQALDGLPLAEYLVPAAMQTVALGSAVGGFGSGLGAGGDLTGDGLGDLVVCAPGWIPIGLGISFNAGGIVALEASTGAAVTMIPGTQQNESPGCLGSINPEVGGVLILPGSGMGGPGKIVVGSPETDTASVNGVGSLRVYGAAGGTPVLGVVGTAQYEYLGWRTIGGKDLTGDGYADFVTLRWPNSWVPFAVLCCPYPRVDVYSGATRQLAYTKLLFPSGPLGEWGVRRLDLVPDVSGDGLADLLVSMTGLTIPAVQDDCEIKLYSGVSGTDVDAWALSDPQYGLPYGYMGYEGRGVGDVNNDGWGDLGILRQVGLPSLQSTLEVFGRRNLGVVGLLSPGGQATMEVDTPKHGGRPYILLFSGAPGPPVTVGPFVIPLAPDAVFAGSLQLGLIGTLDPSGQGSLAIPIPNDPSLSGATVYASGVVVDPGSSYGIGTILTRMAVTIL